MSSWIILRTAGRHTLRLAKTLGEDGFDVWTPTEVRKIRIPRANIRREATLPLMPSYIFARSIHLIDLLQLAEQTVKPRRGSGPAHADFSVMHYHDSIPLVGDAQLNALRHLEAKRTPRAKAQRTFAQGVEVRVKIEGGSFGGMTGKVEKSDHGYSLVCFSDRLRVKIATSLLSSDVVGNQTRLNEFKAQKAA